MRRLVCVAGPLRDAVIEIAERGLTVGRSSECDIAIPDKTLSRAHCAIEVRGEAVWIVDRGGRNGTTVNGASVAEQALQPGDRVQIGACTFVVDDDDRNGAADADANATVDLDPAAARYLAAGGVPPSARATLDQRRTRDLTALLSFNHQIQPVRDRAVVHQIIVDTLTALFGGALTALSLFPHAAADALLIQHRADGSGTIGVSRTVLGRVRAAGRAVLCNDVRADDALTSPQSVAQSPVRSILCAPLFVAGEVRGALYVAATRPEFFFGCDDLELITALANVASLALDNIGHLEWLSREVARSSTERAPSRH